MGGACSTCWGDREGPYRALVSKPEGNRAPGSPRGRWKNNIGIDFQHTMMGGGEGEDWNNLAQIREKWLALVNTVMKIPAP